jgi:DNA-directed RNA polymerase specialized sigma subunit
MIRSETEYQEALTRLRDDADFAQQQRAALAAAGDLSPEQIERAMQPTLSFQAQLEDEVRWYERVRRRDFETLNRLTDIGRLLIALRIANGVTQRDLATMLGVSEAQVSRDERNEYHNITVERAQRILDALRESVTVGVADRAAFREKELAGVG